MKKMNFNKKKSEDKWQKKPQKPVFKATPTEFSVSENECIISGRNAVKELLASDRDIDKIYVAKGDREGSINQLFAIATERKIPVVEVDRTKLDQISGGGRHQGIVALAAERNYSSVEEMLEYAASLNEKPFIIVCDCLEDPHNLGAVIRSAECCGAHGVIIPKRRSVGLTPTVAKASAGAIEHMRVAKVTNIATTIDELKEKGLWIYGADMGGEAYYNTDLKGAVALVLGNEGSGMSRLVREKCDFILSIPLYGSVDSMNVSCAGAVLMSEIARQRNLK